MGLPSAEALIMLINGGSYTVGISAIVNCAVFLFNFALVRRYEPIRDVV
jgi:hypothetical protein